MGRLRAPRLITFALLMLGTGIASATDFPACPPGKHPEYRATEVTACNSWVPSLGAVKSCLSSFACANKPATVNGAQLYACTTDGTLDAWGTNTRRIKVYWDYYGTHYDGFQKYVVEQRCVDGGDPDGVCSTPAGSTAVLDDGANGLSGAFGGNLCGTDNCQYKKVAGLGLSSATSVLGESTGAYCDSPDTFPEESVVTDDDLYLKDADLTATYDTATRCGTFNGERICVGGLANGQCAKTSGGQGICVMAMDESISSPEAPDTGTPGTPAVPDYVVDDSVNNSTVNIYNTTTVNNSTHVPGPGDPIEGDDDNDGECDPGEACAEIEEGECAEGEDCTATFGELGEVPTIGESLAEFSSRAASSPIGRAIDDLGSVLPSGGACPTVSFNALDRTFEVNAQCVLMDRYGGVIHAVFVAMFALVAVFLFFKA